MFRFNGSDVEGLRYQIVTQTAPYYVTDWFLAWGTLPARFEPAGIVGHDAYREEGARSPIPDEAVVRAREPRGT